jgi:pyrimidine operon attenuation protein / uracil phosphoribosyltransferase
MSKVTIPDIEEIYAELLADLRADMAVSGIHPYLIGIHTGGAWVAERLHKDLGLEGRVGFLSSAFHRDDFSQRGLPSEIKTTDIGFDINDAHVILVDDILYTGRTIRAALNEIFDYGRPASVELAVLLDRGGRQLPIQPSYCGAYIELAETEQFVLSRTAEKFTLSLTVKEGA